MRFFCVTLLLLRWNHLVNASTDGWQYFGEVGGLDDIIQTMGTSLMRYDFGIKGKDSFDSVEEALITTGRHITSTNIIISTINDFPIGDDALTLRFGRMVLTKGSLFSSTTTDWYSHYYYRENDEYYKKDDGIADSFAIYAKKGNPWIEVGALNAMESLSSKYPPWQYEYGISSSTPYGLIRKVTFLKSSERMMVETLDPQPMGYIESSLNWCKTVFYKSTTATDWYKSYHYTEKSGSVLSLITGDITGNANSEKIYIRLLDSSYNKLNVLSNLFGNTGSYPPSEYQWAVNYAVNTGDIWFDDVIISGWNAAKRATSVHSFKDKTVDVNGIHMARLMGPGYPKVVAYDGFSGAGGIELSANYGNYMYTYYRRVNPWIYIGKVSDIETLAPKFKFTQYEYGIKYDTISNSIKRITVNEWNRGMRISTVDYYPLNGDYATMTLKFGKTVLTKGLTNNPTADDWYHAYYYQVNDAYYKSNGISNDVELYIRDIETDDAYEYLGCYWDKTFQQYAVGPIYSSYDVYECHKRCIDYKYFGIKGTSCSCDNSIDNVNKEGKADESSCFSDEQISVPPNPYPYKTAVVTNLWHENHFQSVTVKVKSCKGYRISPTDTFVPNTLKFQLKGENAQSRWFWINQATSAALPQNGESSEYGDVDWEIPQDFGKLYSAKVSFSDANIDYCISEFDVTISGKIYQFGSTHFGNGLFLSSGCDTTYVPTPYNIDENSYFKCFDGDFQLATWTNRAIFDISLHSCIGSGSGMAATNMDKKLYTAVTGKKKSLPGYISSIVYLDTAAEWKPDTTRMYQLNMEKYIDTLLTLTITNRHISDNLCIDEVSLPAESALYLSTNDIGGAANSVSLSAIFKYPVCKTQVVGMRVDYESSKSELLKGDSSITGLECVNHNRLLTSTCSISQSYELTKSTSYAISSENTKTNEYSWGLESSVSYGESSSESFSTSDEFSWGLSQEVTIGVETQAGGLFAKATSKLEVAVGGNQQWTSSTESVNEKSTSKDSTTGENEQTTEGTEATKGTESVYETSSTTSIECSAEMDVPPSHSISYNLIFNAFNTSIKTYSDLKLTLCSAFFDPLKPKDDSHYIYIDNIPGVIEHKETTACNVEFSPAKYLRNDIKCEDERQLSILQSSDNLAICRSDGTYDGCQCDKAKEICWCVDPEGNKLDDKTAEVHESRVWEEVCLNDLKCADSDINNDALLAAWEHSMDCTRLQKLAIYQDDDYLPRCRSDGTYDGCQCTMGKLNTRTKCWCSTPDGANVNLKAMYVEDGMTYQQVCSQKLQCTASDVVYTGDIISIPPTDYTPIIQNTFQLLAVISWMIIIGLFVHQKWCKRNNKYQSLYDDDGIESNDKLNP